MARKQVVIVITTVAVTVFLLSVLGNKAFAQLTANQLFRGSDAFGSGAFGSSRDGGSRSHNGVDIVATAGQQIFSPITGTVTRIAYPYSTGNYTGLEIVNDTYTIKIFYITPKVSVGSQVKKGQYIATAQNIAAKYPGITNHIHFEVYNKQGQIINPTKMF